MDLKFFLTHSMSAYRRENFSSMCESLMQIFYSSNMFFFSKSLLTLHDLAKKSLQFYARINFFVINALFLQVFKKEKSFLIKKKTCEESHI